MNQRISTILLRMDMIREDENESIFDCFGCPCVAVCCWNCCRNVFTIYDICYLFELLIFFTIFREVKRSPLLSGNLVFLTTRKSETSLNDFAVSSTLRKFVIFDTIGQSAMAEPDGGRRFSAGLCTPRVFFFALISNLIKKIYYSGDKWPFALWTRDQGPGLLPPVHWRRLEITVRLDIVLAIRILW